MYLVPPSPQAYAAQALDMMDDGYYAHGQAWKTARAEAHRSVADATAYAETLQPLRKALAVAGGTHSRLFDSGESLADAAPSRQMPTVHTHGDITTVTVPTETSDDEGFIQAYADGIAQGINAARRDTTCGWTVDLRDNGGGNMNPMLAGLSPLLPDGKLLGFVRRDGDATNVVAHGGSISVGGTTTTSVTDYKKINQPVAVLQGTHTASSGEVVVLAFKASGHAASFGSRTAGYSSANQTLTLYDGTQMLLTTALDADVNGEIYGDAIEPDHAADPDRAMDAAKQWLHHQCGH